MAKWEHSDIIDQALNYLKNNGTRLCVCSTQPTTYTEAISTYKLAIKTIGPSDFTGPSAGLVSGRRITVNQQTGITVDVEGDAQHVAVVDSANSKLLLVDICTLQHIYAGNTVNVPAFDDEYGAPT